MFRPLILVDCDGVIADFCGLYLHLHSYLNQVHKSHSDVTAFDFAKCVATAEEDERIWRHLDETEGLIDGLHLIDGASAGLDELRTMGRVVCLTSPHTGPYFAGERIRWLMRVAGFKKRDIVIASDKTLVPGNVLIDDKMSNVCDWHSAHTNGQGILFDAPYNREPGAPVRVRGWKQAVSAVRVACGLVAP